MKFRIRASLKTINKKALLPDLFRHPLSTSKMEIAEQVRKDSQGF